MNQRCLITKYKKSSPYLKGEYHPIIDWPKSGTIGLVLRRTAYHGHYKIFKGMTKTRGQKSRDTVSLSKALYGWPNVFERIV